MLETGVQVLRSCVGMKERAQVTTTTQTDEAIQDWYMEGKMMGRVEEREGN